MKRLRLGMGEHQLCTLLKIPNMARPWVQSRWFGLSYRCTDNLQWATRFPGERTARDFAECHLAGQSYDVVQVLATTTLSTVFTRRIVDTFPPLEKSHGPAPG